MRYEDIKPNTHTRTKEMVGILLNEGCDVLNGSPLWVLFVTVVVLAHLTPLILFYINDPPPTSEYVEIGGKLFTIPTISRTWRSKNALWPVGLCVIINVIVYPSCMVETGNILCLVFGVLLAGFVFCFNDESGPVSKVHGFFAFGFFVYLLWLVKALSIYLPEDYIWWWPYIFMGLTILIMLFYNISEACKHNEKEKFKHWPWGIALAEHVFVLSFEIYLITIG